MRASPECRDELFERVQRALSLPTKKEAEHVVSAVILSLARPPCSPIWTRMDSLSSSTALASSMCTIGRGFAGRSGSLERRFRRRCCGRSSSSVWDCFADGSGLAEPITSLSIKDVVAYRKESAKSERSVSGTFERLAGEARRCRKGWGLQRHDKRHHRDRHRPGSPFLESRNGFRLREVYGDLAKGALKYLGGRTARCNYSEVTCLGALAGANCQKNLTCGRRHLERAKLPMIQDFQ